MQKTRKGLGRGLSALIPDADMEFLSRVARGDDDAGQATLPLKTGKRRTAAATKATAKQVSGENPSPTQNSPATSAGSDGASSITGEPLAALAELIPLAQIEANPYQPRRTFSAEEMQELIDSVKEHGILQPVLVRPMEEVDASAVSAATQKPKKSTPRFQLIAGERRWRAAQAAELAAIPAIIRRVSDQQALELAVIENVQRHDISALDAAVAYRRLSQEFSLSQEEIAKRVGKSRVSIANTLRLLDLPVEVQKAIEDGELTEGHGRAILQAEGDGARRAVFRRVLRDKLSVRSTEELARNTRPEDESAPGTNSTDDDAPLPTRMPPEIRRIEEGLQKHLGTRVRLRARKRGGQLVIQYFSNEELDRLLKVLMK